ncbi:MAG: nucleoid-associated protein [Gallionellaceae bacterium]
MISLDFTQVVLQQLITHHVGNKLRDEEFMPSTEVSTIEDDSKDLLLKYFLLPIKAEELFLFSHAVKLELNELFTIAKAIFSNQNTFIDSSQSIAKLLYEQSMHPKIKEGELNIAYFSNILFDDEMVEAIGIFKSETNVPFIKMQNQQENFSIKHDYGFEIKGMDKGCIIFNVDENEGYKIAIVDNANKSAEAQYWKDDFLKIKAISNEFHQTTQFLGITKNFVTKQLSEELELSQADKINLLNSSVEYFKTHESFDKNEFEEEVLQDSEMITSFRNYDSKYRQENNIDSADCFTISLQAVKKQSRVFRRVLKLDKNFHIYIHGRRELIEQGVEADGRKFYKIYFQQES